MIGLVGCAPVAAAPEPSPTSTPEPSPTVEPAVGQSVLPLACADLLTAADLAQLVPSVRTVVDGEHLAQTLTAAAEAQGGVLTCGWALDQYQRTDWQNEVSLTVSPSTEIAISADTGAGFTWTPVEGEHPTGISGGCDLGDIAYCHAVQLRQGYLVELTVGARVSESAPSLAPPTLEILERVGSKIDGAGDPRAVVQSVGAADPASVCADADVRSIVEARGATGEPEVTTRDTRASDVPVTICTWPLLDDSEGIQVQVVPGGAWAYDRIAAGVSIGLLSFDPVPDADYLTGSGTGRAAIRAFGDDLIEITVPGRADDPAAWDALLAATW